MMAEIGWGQFADLEAIGSPFSKCSDFKEVSFDEANSDNYKSWMHAAHGMIFTKLPGKLWNLFPKNATALMQMRFDGFVGFPGGVIDDGEAVIVNAVNREFQEEIGFDVNSFGFKQEHHVVSHVNHSIKLVTHFYAQEVQESDFCLIEKATLDAPEWGIETFGIIRVPMYIAGDGYRGFPVFLSNKFAGNAKEQLLLTLQRKEILSEKVLKTVIEAAENYASKTGNNNQ